MGADVTVLTRTADKMADAKALGAKNILLSTDREAMKSAANSFDMILNTIPVPHPVAHYMPLLKVDCAQVLVGVIGTLPEMHSMHLLGRRILTGSGIGGIAETQEMLDFCAEKNILPEIEMIAMQDVNNAYDRMEKSDVRYRFVIDMETLA
jgi:alcohol dehydrogenase (NADP+)